MDIDTVLQNVQERDKWRQRLQALSTTLAEVTDQRKRIQGRLRKLRSELRRLGAYSEALLDRSRFAFAQEAGNASGNPRIPAR